MGKGLADVLIEEFDWVNTAIYASFKNTRSKLFLTDAEQQESEGGDNFSL